MSHVLTLNSLRNSEPLMMVKVLIVDYVSGGETVAVSEVNCGATAIDALLFGTVPATQNSLAVPLFPLLDTGKIKLFRFVSGSPAEIPSTTALNATVNALVHISSF